MRKIFYLLPMLLLQHPPSFSQFRLGLTGNAVYSGNTLKHEGFYNTIGLFLGDRYYLTVTQVGDTKPLYSYSAGLVAEEMISSGFSVRLDLEFIQKGWKETVAYNDSVNTPGAPQLQPSYPQYPLYHANYLETFKINYLETPMYFLFHPYLRNAKLFFGVGPYLGFALTGKYIFHVLHTDNPVIKDSIDFIAVNKYEDKRAALHANAIDNGVSVIAGLELRTGMFFNARFNAGLKNVMTDRYLIFSNRYYYISLGMGFFFHKL